MDNLRFKFRGKRVDNGVWVYGFYFKEAIENEDKQGFDYLSFIKAEYGDHYKNYEVIPETVGQYTGLKDASGFEIYEGDILQGDGVFEVIFHDSAWWLFSVLDKTEQWSFAECNIPKCQIIGNIHETPELLEK